MVGNIVFPKEALKDGMVRGNFIRDGLVHDIVRDWVDEIKALQRKLCFPPYRAALEYITPKIEISALATPEAIGKLLQNIAPTTPILLAAEAAKPPFAAPATPSVPSGPKPLCPSPLR